MPSSESNRWWNRASLTYPNSLSTIEAEQLQEISMKHSRAGDEVDSAAENSVSPHGGVNHSRAGRKPGNWRKFFKQMCNFKAATTLTLH